MWIAGDFVNFKCATSSLVNAVLRAVCQDPDYGFYDDGQGRNIIVEYSSPNIAKPFHIGHLRPTILGAFLRNLYVKLHWDVNAMNYLGDWGTQFAVIYVGYDQYGNEEDLIADPCKHLFDVYVKVNKDAKTDDSTKSRIMLKAAEFFKRMEDGDEEAVNWWKRIRKLTVRRYKADYQMLNAHFDTYSAESKVSKALQDETLSHLQDLGKIVDEEMKDNPGFVAQRVDLEQYHLGKGVLRKGNGTSIYLSRDVAEAVRRYQTCQFDKMIYVVASQQDVHLARVMKILELREFHWAVNGQIEHINHGLISGPKRSDGHNTKFSTRNGQVTFLDETIGAITASIQGEMRRHSRIDDAIVQQQVAQELAISLLKINDFSRRRIRDYAADWSHPEVYLPSGTKLARDNGLFIQFTYARLVSLRRRNADLLININPEAIDTSLLIGDDVHRLIFLLGKYPDVIDAALATHQPCKIVHFAFDLCKSVRRLWKSAPVFQEKDQELARARMFMFDCALKVLKSAMELLTLRPQESF
ncbi:hypothetical protein ONZ45_g13735 [Pleurotus djamor]|nr:hypothetical protein ONZ45_g13735 [Pleurotus djamor]